MWVLYMFDSKDNFTLYGTYDDLESLDIDFFTLRFALKQLKNPNLMLAISYEGEK